MNHYYQMDSNGFFVKDVFADVQPADTLTVQPPQNPSLLKAKWNGTQWVEGATADEIAAINAPMVPTPTIEQQQIAQLLLITAQQAQQIAALQGATTNG